MALGISDGGTLKIAFCDSIVANHVFAEERTGQTDWIRFLDARGSFDLQSPLVLDLDETHATFGVSVSRTVDLAPGGQISVVAVGSDEEQAAMFMIPDMGLTTDSWLKPDGSIVESPCD